MAGREETSLQEYGDATLLTACTEGARFRAMWYAVSQTIENPLRYPKRTASIVQADATREDVEMAKELYIAHRRNCQHCASVHARMMELLTQDVEPLCEPNS